MIHFKLKVDGMHDVFGHENSDKAKPGQEILCQQDCQILWASRKKERVLTCAKENCLTESAEVLDTSVS